MKKATVLAFFLALVTAYVQVPALAATITNIVFTPVSPAVLDFGENVNFTFDFELDMQDARIFGRPFEDGALRLDYAAHPSPTYMGGTSGSGTGFFTILDLGQTVAHVDQVRFQILTRGRFLNRAAGAVR